MLEKCVLGNHEEHTKYCFDIYDLNGDGAISREEMLNMLKTSLGRQGLDDDPDEGVKDLIDMTLRKLDRDKDGKVSFKVCPIFIKKKRKKKKEKMLFFWQFFFQDWSTTVTDEPLMMEAFGPCLPSKRQADIFMSKVEAEFNGE